jgi:hypothetical protein
MGLFDIDAIMRDLKHSTSLYNKARDNEAKIPVLVDLKVHRNDLDKSLKAKKVLDNQLNSAKRYLSDADRILRMDVDDINMNELKDLLEKVKRITKK